jgi:hypothetical protein
MKIGSLMKKDNRGLDVITASRAVPETPLAVEISVFYSVLNKARDQAWKMGDQAMKKAVSRDTHSIKGDCF